MSPANKSNGTLKHYPALLAKNGKALGLSENGSQADGKWRIEGVYVRPFSAVK